MVGQDDNGLDGEGFFGFDGVKGLAQVVDGLGVVEDGLPLMGDNGKKVGGSWGGCTAVVHGDALRMVIWGWLSAWGVGFRFAAPNLLSFRILLLVKKSYPKY